VVWRTVCVQRVKPSQLSDRPPVLLRPQGGVVQRVRVGHTRKQERLSSRPVEKTGKLHEVLRSCTSARLDRRQLSRVRAPEGAYRRLVVKVSGNDHLYLSRSRATLSADVARVSTSLSFFCHPGRAARLVARPTSLVPRGPAVRDHLSHPPSQLLVLYSFEALCAPCPASHHHACSHLPRTCRWPPRPPLVIIRTHAAPLLSPRIDDRWQGTREPHRIKMSQSSAPADGRAAASDAPLVAPVVVGPMGTTTVNALPNELLLRIFTFLGWYDCTEGSRTLITSVHGVCRRWRALCGDTPKVHLDMRVRDGAPLEQHKNDAVGTRMAVMLARRFKHVVSIVCGSGSNSDLVVAALVSHCPELTSANLTECGDITDVSIMSLAMHCPRLTVVCIDWCTLVTDVGVAALAEQCTHLKKVSLDRCSQITDASVLAIAAHCPRLAFADFSGCDTLTDMSFVELAEKCPGLMALIISHNSNPSDATLFALAQHCPLLEYVYFHETDMTDAGVCELAAYCKQLERVVFLSVDNLTDVAVVALAEGCPRLLDVGFRSCQSLTDASVIALFQHCTKLVDVDFSGCTNLTNGAVVALGVLLPKHFSNFAHVEIRLTDCPAIDDSACAVLETLLPGLTIERD
jgi:hypothetical protein